MKKFDIFLTLFYVISCKIKFSNCLLRNISDFSLYTEILDEILTVCHKNYKTIGIYEDIENNLQVWKNDFFISQMRLTKPRLKDKEAPKKRKKWNLDAFIIMLTEKESFESILMRIKLTKWWNVLIPFYIVSKESTKCQDRFIVLRCAWRTHLLNVNFLCVAEKNQVIIYTYNPYANYGPQWAEIETKMIKDDPYKFFSRLYTRGNICYGLDFDRTKFINNTIVKVKMLFNDIYYYDSTIPSRIYNESDFDDIVPTAKPELLNLLKKFLHIRYEFDIVTLTDYRNNPRLASEHKTFVDFLYITSRRYTPMYAIIYPSIYKEYHIVSHYQGHKNLLQQIYNLFGIWLIAFMIGLLAVTFVVIWCSNKKKKIAFPIFEIIRLLVNASLMSEMSSPSLRIFFSMVFFYFLIIQTLLQGNLLKFLTDPALKNLANTLSDLEGNAYKTIYVDSAVQDFIAYDPMLELKVKNITDFELCWEKLQEDNTATCIMENGVCCIIVKDQSVYKTPHAIFKKYHHYIAEHDSPFNDRINKVFMSMWELGFSDYLMHRFPPNDCFETLQRKKAAERFIRARISFKSIFPLLIFLISGLSSATICFALENIIYYSKCTRITTIIRQYRNLKYYVQKKV